jgi:hypothetical protein
LTLQGPIDREIVQKKCLYGPPINSGLFERILAKYAIIADIFPGFDPGSEQMLMNMGFCGSPARRDFSVPGIGRQEQSYSWDRPLDGRFKKTGGGPIGSSAYF